MAISIKRYVDITSGVGAGATVKQRELITRVFTVNPLVPTASHIEFTSADDVSTYFGSTSEEYARAVFYFGWVSKNIRRAKKISFARWVNAAVAPIAYGAKGAQSLSAWQAITNGSMSLTLAGDTASLTALNFSAAASLTAVAGVIQTAIRAAKALPLWAGATVTFDSTNQRFILTGGTTGPASIAIAAGATNDIAALAGWLTGAVLSNGSAVETITTTLSNSAQADNNFGTLVFSDSAALTESQVIEAATWNDAQNVMYQYHHRVTTANAATWAAALLGLSGVGLTLTSPVSGEYPEMVPGIVLAATDYTARNATQNYMFQQFTLTPSVTTNADADTYDPLRVNYYGRTQTAGQTIDFYQRGVLMGLASDPVDMNIYGNEQWLKDAAASQIMTLLLAMAKISANSQGKSQLLTVLHSVVDTALLNGTISVGKSLSTIQQLYITEQTGDDKAWQQVQQVGYWLGVDMQSATTTDGRVEWTAVYTLIYAKDDCVRAVDGTHVLI
jgi:hypothetical protein